MDRFLSCDWGTSSFRLRLVNAADLSIIAATHSGKGIAATFQAWQQTGQSEPEARLHFYQQLIQQQIQVIEEQLHTSLEHIPLLISGMASSSIGMVELPYQPLPFSIDGAGVTTRSIPAQPDFKHEILLISGVKSEDDVMRGEETQLIGCMTEDLAATGESTVIFPGTHSKHITLKGRQAVAFKTYMTGEFFAVLCEHSILKGAVKGTPANASLSFAASFSQGVKDAAGFNLLHAAFRVRTNHLFGVLSQEENLEYLSGLLIGTELRELQQKPAGKIYLCCGSSLQPYYETALQVAGLGEQLVILPAQWVDEAAIRGQYKIFNQLKTTHAS